MKKENLETNIENEHKLNYLKQHKSNISVNSSKMYNIIKQNIPAEYHKDILSCFEFNDFQVQTQTKPLHLFKSWDDFLKREDLLKIGTKFKPDVNFEITDEFIRDYGTQFKDLYEPHLIVKEGVMPIFVKSLGSEYENFYKKNPHTFAHGMATMGSLTGFVRGIFQFEDDTELVATNANNISWPTPTPSGSKLECEATIINIVDKKCHNLPAKELTYKFIVRSDKIPIREGETQARPVVVGDWNIMYVSPANKYL